MLDRRDDIVSRVADGHVDIPRMKAGGLTAAFFSIWVDSRYGSGSAFRRALDLISAVKTLADSNRDVERPTNSDAVRPAAARGHVAALPSVQGGSSMQKSPTNL